jgi:fluoride exporter
MKSIILVMVGGGIGAVLRFQLGRILVTSPSGWPWGTFAANVVGGLLMGVLAAWLLRAGQGAENMRLLLGVGLLGGFTTFSSYSLELVQMVQNGQGLMAIIYAIGSAVIAVSALLAGLMLTQWMLS